jgi:hypothetical protein
MPETDTTIGNDLKPKEQIHVILKEYEAARKELDEDIRYLSTVSVTILLAAAAGLWGLGDKWNLSFLPFLIPLVLTIIHCLRTSRLINAIEIGRSLARVEDRIFTISGKVLLRHETEFVISRLKHPRVGFLWEMAFVIGYVTLSFGVFFYADPELKERFWKLRRFHQLLWAATFVVPPGLAVWFAYKRARIQVEPFNTGLMKHIVTARTVTPPSKSR